MPLNRLGGGLRLEYVAADAVCGPRDLPDSVLGGFCYAHPAVRKPIADLPLLAVDMALAVADGAVCELWHGDGPTRAGRAGAIDYREAQDFLFGCLDIDETSPRGDAAAAGRTPLEAATESAYRAIFELLEARGFASMLRVWNYFPAINAESHALERYRQFNIGRQQAFVAHARPVVSNVPAACALGSAAGGVQIAFLATRAPVVAIENPRQVSAYHYPSQYGPRSPTFARAGLASVGGDDVLFVSGTASIVGHETLHAGDVAAQTRECLQNIAAVVDEANRVAGRTRFGLEALAYKVYVRRLDDADAVEREITAFIGASVPALILQADVCRADLLVEIEASGGHAVTPLPALADVADRV